MGFTRRSFLLSGIGAAAMVAITADTAHIAARHVEPSPVERLTFPAVAAHRGGLATGPENTLHLFRKTTTNHPAAALEMDVRQLKDGALVVFHDWRIDRVAADGKTGIAEHMTSAEWRKLRIKDPLGGPPAPAVFLQDVLDEYAGTNTVLLPELVTHAGRNTFIETVWPYRGQTIVQCWNDEITSVFARAGLNALQLSDGETVKPVRGIHSFAVHESMVTRGVCETVHAAGAKMWVWGSTVKPNDSRYLGLGVDGIMTDNPDG